MEEVIFVTHNKGKIESAKRQLEQVNFKIFEYEVYASFTEAFKSIVFLQL